MNQAQALPNAPKFAPPLDPKSCTGKWLMPCLDITEKLQELEKDMHKAWRKVERDKKDAPAYLINKAAYLRRVFDHFLYTLHCQASKQKDRGTFKKPVRLKRIEEPNMLNALRNLAEGRHYDVGALKPPPPREPEQTPIVKRELSESPTQADDARDEDSPESNTAGPCTGTRNSDVTQEFRQSQETESSVQHDTFKAHVAGPRGYSKGKRQRGDSVETDEEPLIKRKLAPLDPEGSEDEEPNLLLQMNWGPPGATSFSTKEWPFFSKSRDRGQPLILPNLWSSDRPHLNKNISLASARMWSATYPMLRTVMQDMPIAPEDLQPNPKKTMRLRFWEAQRAQALALLERMEETFQAAGNAGTAAIPHGRTFAPIRFEKT
ncbi:hypothetical protein FS837_004057 [Tulasnella sp. UAMH 9824]|nr:hypothetical protein FS837_004057 [Tulasnella sp. UAMH 9824]